MPHATLVQILVPLEPLGTGAERRAHLKRLADELTAAFGGLTAYVHAPAEGLWEERPGRTVQEKVVVYEVMAPTLDEDWWATYRAELERRFAQERVLIRALAAHLL
jgi:hypothetical protein